MTDTGISPVAHRRRRFMVSLHLLLSPLTAVIFLVVRGVSGGLDRVDHLVLGAWALCLTGAPFVLRDVRRGRRRLAGHAPEATGSR